MYTRYAFFDGTIWNKISFFQKLCFLLPFLTIFEKKNVFLLLFTNAKPTHLLFGVVKDRQYFIIPKQVRRQTFHPKNATNI